METTKSVPPEIKAVGLVNDLDSRDGLLHPLTDAFRALIKHEKKPADEVIGDLIGCLKAVALDETGTHALNLIKEIRPDVIKKIFGVDISEQYYALDTNTIRVSEPITSMVQYPPLNPTGIQNYQRASIEVITETQENKEKALSIVKALLASQSDVI